MNPTPAQPLSPRGVSLIEAIVAIGVLSVALPLVLGTIAQSGDSSVSSRAETRCSWVIPACLNEIEASRQGRSQYFPATSTGETFDQWYLAFSGDGRTLGKVEAADYDNGLQNLAGQTVRYLVAMQAETDPNRTTGSSSSAAMLRLRITLEYPAAAPAAKRQQLTFFTRLP